MRSGKSALWSARCCLLVSALLSANACLAQVAFDHPIPVGADDKVYLSSADAKIAYVFPYALIMKNAPRIETTKKVTIIHFTAGLKAGYVADVQGEVTKVAPGVTVRVFRGLNSTVLPNSATDIDPKYKPVLVPLGEPANFGSDVEYSLTLRRRRCWFSDRTARVINETFQAKEPRNVGVIEYSFVAVAGSQTIMGKTDIPLFVGGN
jgi:hypothetical protein